MKTRSATPDIGAGGGIETPTEMTTFCSSGFRKINPKKKHKLPRMLNVTHLQALLKSNNSVLKTKLN